MTPSNSSGDPFRDCVYCGVDCKVDDPEHAADCPSSTGVFPVRAKDQRPCPHCGEPTIPAMCCMDCGAELKPGDHYMHREVDAGDVSLPGIAGAAVYEIICVGCKAKEELA